MSVKSAGVLLYRIRAELEVLLIHMGGPIWAKKDFGAWSIPKGVIRLEEDPFDAAKREFHGETGYAGAAAWRQSQDREEVSDTDGNYFGLDSDTSFSATALRADRPLSKCGPMMRSGFVNTLMTFIM